MGKTAIVFSGQGAQYAGMGKYLYDNFESARQVFLTAESLRKNTIAQCFEGSKEELQKTENTQPCLFTAGIAAAFALREKGLKASGCAGFSLGEFAAIVYSGILSFEDGFKLVCKRAEIMAQYTDNNGAMAAVLKLDTSAVEQLCLETGGVYPVNYNCEGQTVIAGTADKIAEFSQKAAALGGKSIKLAVSGAFHSPYMQKAFEKFSGELNNYSFRKAKMPLYSNVTALPYGDNTAELLALQIKSPVLWQKTIQNMIADGYDSFIEAGAGNTLCGLIKRIDGNVKIFGTNNLEEFDAVISADLK